MKTMKTPPLPSGQEPVVVTGVPRSGTSWVGKLLQASGELTYINEPLNPAHPPGRSPGVLRATVGQAYQYITAANEEGTGVTTAIRVAAKSVALVEKALAIP